MMGWRWSFRAREGRVESIRLWIWWRNMTTPEKVFAEVRALPETVAREVLDFVGFLKTRQAKGKSVQRDMSAFDRFGAVYDGHFNRDELHDRKVLRTPGRV